MSDSMRESFREEIARLTATVEAQGQIIQSLHFNLAKAHAGANAAQADRDALTAEVERLNRLMAAGRETLDAKERTIAQQHTDWAELQAEVDALRQERDEARKESEWMERRLTALQAQQRVMRDPERKMVCDILANGKTYTQPVEG